MKKLYLTLLGAALAFGATARELTFYYGDNVIQSGSTITFDGVEIDDYGDYYEVTMEPKLYLATDIYSNTIEVKATCTSGQTIQLCAGGNCMKGVSVTKSGVKLNPGTKLNLQFDYVDELDAGVPVPTVTTVIEAVDTKHTETAKSFTIVMGQNASVEVIQNQSEITVTKAGIVYTLSEPLHFALFNITGKQIVSTTVSGTGMIPADGLAKGIYVYRAGKHSGKIIVK